MNKFLKTRGTQILGNTGKPLFLKGVNLGGWLMTEGYILHSPNFPEQKFRRNFQKALGHKSLCDFEKAFRSHFINEEDFKTISHLGFNCIRLPFHYRLVETKPYQHRSKDIIFLDQAIRWAKKYKLWIILDLHAAPGAQNCDWHSDSTGRAKLWTNVKNRARTYALWEYIADRYKNETQIAGYDVLNESVLEDEKLLNQFYGKLIKCIRSVDRNHILFIEGNKWATDLQCLNHFEENNLALSIHTYQPLDFTFNFVPHHSYPLKQNGMLWNRKALKDMLLTYANIAQKRQVPIFVGEFGVNNRQGIYGEEIWVQDILFCFKEFGFHWTYWTYKAIKNSIFPDGIFSYHENPPWVNRQGPVMGWETYQNHWRERKQEIMESWKTKNFKPNTHIISVLKNAARP